MANFHGSWTTVDMITAMEYATDQINFKKCKDQDILKKICPSGQTDCLVWKENTNTKTWMTPTLITKSVCKNDSDCADVFGAPQCLGKVCSSKPEAHSGSCNIATKEMCDYVSELPYTCDDKGNCEDVLVPIQCEKDADCGKGNCKGKQCVCSKDNDCGKDDMCVDNICVKHPNTNYTEWRPVIDCSSEFPCPGGLRCDSNKRCKCVNDGQCPGNSKCEDSECKGGRCVLGNWPLRHWCERPKTRCPLDEETGKYPDECKGSSKKPGVVDVPAFEYNTEYGSCHLTQPYCHYYGTKYRGGGYCESDSDCGDDGKNTCHKKNENDENGTCSGPHSTCKVSSGQAAGEFIVGKAVWRFFKNGLTCHGHENYDPNKLPDRINTIFNGYPEKVVVKGDKRDMRSRRMLFPNYVGKINLYYILWKDGKKGTGIDASEVRKEFPKNVFKKDGKKVVMLKKADVISGGDPKLKKLYLVLNSLHFFDNLMTPSNK